MAMNKSDYLRQNYESWTLEQQSRFEFFYRSHFLRSKVKDAIIESLGKRQAISDEVAIVVSSLTKLFVGELVENAAKIAQDLETSTQPIHPDHIKEAFLRMQAIGQINSVLESKTMSSKRSRMNIFEYDDQLSDSLSISATAHNDDLEKIEDFSDSNQASTAPSTAQISIDPNYKYETRNDRSDSTNQNTSAFTGNSEEPLKGIVAEDSGATTSVKVKNNNVVVTVVVQSSNEVDINAKSDIITPPQLIEEESSNEDDDIFDDFDA